MPRWALDELIRTGRVVNLMADAVADGNGDHDLTTPLRRRQPTRRIRYRTVEQLTLLSDN